MKVYFASDHAGFELKNALIAYVHGMLGADTEDMGPLAFDAGDDYPDFVLPLARKVAAESESLGIIIGASGQGEMMCANRIPGARAALYYGPTSQIQTDTAGNNLSILAGTRAHNNANIISLGAKFISTEEAESAVSEWLSTPFSGEERHMRRIAKFDYE